ncbi:hypothetical protein HanXRQr2_Chr03g0098071 [Helianthus annuus]|uniref:Uncharacterized protein n=1 Tax=Helianthus annuus TaxID=4232 RepID=A0A9K3JEE8_HELAN|nr:hypothetical protein HanXRQr2_Chr03g0098071 [Helianthus annuus]
MGAKSKVQDEAPPKDAYVSNALYTRLCQRLSVCTVIPEGALVMAGMSLLWRDVKLYPSFQRDDEEEWSLFDFVDPPRHAALKAADRVISEQEPDVLKIPLEHFLLPAVPADPIAYVTISPPSGGGSAIAIEKKPVKVKIIGRKYLATGAGASSVNVTTPAGSAAELTSPTHVSKKRKTVTVPPLTAFEAIQTAYALPLGTTAGVQIENLTTVPSTSLEVTPSAGDETSLTELIRQASVTTVLSCIIPPPPPTAAVTVTISPVSTPLSSSVAPSSLFSSPFSIFSATEKEMPTVSAVHEATSAGGPAASDVGGSSNGIAEDGARLGDDLYLPTINWDPNM